MVINIKEVLAEVVNPLPFSVSVDFSEMEFFGRKPFPSPGTIAGKVESRANVAVLSAELTIRQDTICDSCGNKAQKEIVLPVERVLTLEETEDESLLFCQDGLLDVVSAAADALVLHTEMRILCKPDCKGFCFACGVDRNVEECRCGEKTDPRFDALRSLL